MHARLISAAALAVGLVAGATTPSASAAPDSADPSGDFVFTETTRYLHDYRDDVDDPYVRFELKVVSISDDTTAPEDVIVKIDDGSGRFRPQVWGNTSVPLTLSYDDDGAYAPKAILVDADHRTTVVDLPVLTVLTDHVAPVLTWAKPPRSLIHRMAGWRVLRGTVVDAGYGETSVHYQVMQKRHGRWYYFRDNSRWTEHGRLRWYRGAKTLAATRKLYRNYNSNHDREQPAGTWRTPRIPGLTRGPIVFCLTGTDGNQNETPQRCATGRITRR